ncbi:MAG: hypothetical protein ACTSR8_06945 [Promethearchaeota archaeon]
MTKEEKKRAPIHITKADVERAFKKAEQFKRLLEQGRTKEQIFKDMLRLIEGGE